MFTSKKQSVKSFFLDYKVAAFASSSKFLITDVLKEVETNSKLIVEQGAGDGVLSIKLLKKINKEGKLILIEQNKDFLRILKDVDDQRVILNNGYAEDFNYPSFVGKYEKADSIISSIPFSFLNKNDREKIVKSASRNLKVGGKLIIFHQYSLLMKEVLKKEFGNVKVKFVMRNFFPCFIIIGEKTKHF